MHIFACFFFGWRSSRGGASAYLAHTEIPGTDFEQAEGKCNPMTEQTNPVPQSALLLVKLNVVIGRSGTGSVGRPDPPQVAGRRGQHAHRSVVVCATGRSPKKMPTRKKTALDIRDNTKPGNGSPEVSTEHCDVLATNSRHGDKTLGI